MFRFLTLIICFFAFANISCAENWVEVYKDSPKAFVDVDSIIVKPNGSILYNLKYYNSIYDSYLVASIEYNNQTMGIIKQTILENYLKNPQFFSTRPQEKAFELKQIKSPWFATVNNFVVDYKTKNNIVATDKININEKIKEQKQTNSEKFIDGDFSEYMKNLQIKIKSNWNPIISANSNSVVVLIKIRKDGELLEVKAIKNSANKENEEAALKAVRAAAPFGSFEHITNRESVDVEFTFDYNVFITGTNKTTKPNKKHLQDTNVDYSYF